jgi:hypothetical protein
MCEILSRLGVEIRSTTDTPAAVIRRELKMEQRYKGGEYRMNSKFYEIGRNPWSHWHHIYHTPFSGCKVVGIPHGLQWDMIHSVPAKVILMCRDPESIRQSQEAAKISHPRDYGDDKHGLLYSLGLELIGTKDSPGVITDPAEVQKLKDLFNKKLNDLPDPEIQPWERKNAILVSRQAGVEARLIERKDRVANSMFTKRPLPAFDYKTVWYEDLVADRERITVEIGQWIGADPDRFEYAWLAVNANKNRFAAEKIEEGL